MNYPTFLKKVDSAIKESNIDSLRAFIHEMARTLPEDERDKFLSVLEKFCSSTKKADLKKEKKDLKIEKEINEVIEKLDEIKSEEKTIQCEYNEEWNDWDDDWDEMYEYSDPEDVLSDINEALSLLHKAIDREEYRIGAELAIKLAQLEVPVYGECDDSSLGMDDLILHNLVKTDIQTILKESLYLQYMANSGEKRAEAMVSMMESLDSYSITLEDILSSSTDEIDVPSLLPSWIEALAKRTSHAVDKLLDEALCMLDDPVVILDTASRYAVSHPVLYLCVMRDGVKGKSSSEMRDIGLRAMKEVPVEDKTRSEIALYTALYALEGGDRKSQEKCWMEAFRSSPTVVNFLRVRLLSDNWEEYRDSLRRVYSSYYNSKSQWDRKSLALIMFFDSRFDEVIDKFMNVKEGLGWSSTFMKEGIALLLMLLSKNAEGKGMEAMRQSVFKASSFKKSEFTLGTDIKARASDFNLFNEYFELWKKDITIDEAVCQGWITKLENWIEMRTDAIIKGSKRKYYGECAAYIAALGEVEESRGKERAKETLMLGYKALYPRHHAFHSELVSCGMRR